MATLDKLEIGGVSLRALISFATVVQTLSRVGCPSRPLVMIRNTDGRVNKMFASDVADPTIGSISNLLIVDICYFF